jgi:hypothetical protein
MYTDVSGAGFLFLKDFWRGSDAQQSVEPEVARQARVTLGSGT